MLTLVARSRRNSALQLIAPIIERQSNFFFPRESKQRAQKTLKQRCMVVRARQYEFLFFIGGKQPQSIIVHAQGLTFHSATLIITP